MTVMGRQIIGEMWSSPAPSATFMRHIAVEGGDLGAGVRPDYPQHNATLRLRGMRLLAQVCSARVDHFAGDEARGPWHMTRQSIGLD